jgi:hypothetical protein
MDVAPAPETRKMKTISFSHEGKDVTVGVLRLFSHRVPLFDAHRKVEDFNGEHNTSFKVISPRVADHLLNKTANYGVVAAAFPSPVDAAIGYEKPGCALEDEIVFTLPNDVRVILPAGRYKGEKGIALVVLGLGSADFRSDGANIMIDVAEDRLIAVPGFPATSGFYMPHAETTVPHGEAVEDLSNGARYLARLDSSYAGIMVRTAGFGGDRKVVGAASEPFDGLGIAIFDVVDPKPRVPDSEAATGR